MKSAFLLSKGLLCLYDKQNNTWLLVLEVNSLTLVVGLVDPSLISFLLKLLQRGLASIYQEKIRVSAYNGDTADDICKPSIFL